MDNKKKTRNLLLYIGTPVVVILALTFLFSTQQKSEAATTSEMVTYFKEGRVADYELNYGSGAIKITLNDDKKTVVNGTIADPEEFNEDVEPYFE